MARIRMLSVRLMPALMVIALVCMIAAASLLALGRSDALAGSARQLTELLALAQRIPVHARAALAGDPAAFETLKTTRARYSTLASALGEDVTSSKDAADLLKYSQAIVGASAAIDGVHKAAQEARTLAPQLARSLDNVISALPAPAAQAVTRHVERFELTGMRVQQGLEALAGGIGDPAVIVRRLAEDNDFLGRLVGGLGGEQTGLGLQKVSGVDAENLYKSTSALYERLSAHVRTAISSAERLSAARQAGESLALSAEGFFTRFGAGSELAEAGLLATLTRGTLPLAFASASLIALLLLAAAYAMSGNIRKTLELQASKNERNQEAILRLLDELSSLADGDLTVQATVTEDITGAIADSINYAIEALRELVATINESAVSLEAATRQTQASAGHLAKASVAQSRQVALASESVAAMAASTEQISGNAERSADVARHSVEIAHKGGEAVRRTIDGMNAIRETIQETSKRIKRLGESSQEIGNIVELINDIAEQTNILALNASIQASMAGEAGRGFAVVADEVQRLAERAANATKQIEVLVRTIQADTNEAVVSMERSTTDVVGGALLAENAGAALEEIEQVSNQIASLVQNISASSRQQAAAAQNIARNMGVLREISSQTAENSAATSGSVGKLAELSAQLRKSVAGFRLPQTTALQHASAADLARKPASPANAVSGAGTPAAPAAPAAVPRSAAASKRVSGVGG